MRRMAISAGLVAFVLTTGTAAEALEVKVLADCLFQHSTPADHEVLKKLIIAAIAEDDSQIGGLALSLSGSIVAIATTKCNLAYSQLTEPAFVEATSLYGRQVGERIITDAFARIRQSN